MARVLSHETIEKITALSQRYPARQAALLPALHLAQDELGHISNEAELDIAEVLDVPPTRVHEVSTFYTMFRHEPKGRHVVKMCRNLSCELRGCKQLITKAEQLLGINMGETTPDGRITLEHEECLASCGTGPVLQCNGQLIENLSEEKLEAYLASLT